MFLWGDFIIYLACRFYHRPFNLLSIVIHAKNDISVSHFLLISMFIHVLKQNAVRASLN